MDNSTFMYGANVQANGIRQHYLRFGGSSGDRSTRAPVIIVPGITSPAITWGFVGERFGVHFDTYILDVRGRGMTDAGDGLDYSLAVQAADLICFANALGLDAYSVVGHSMGGRIALKAAMERPPELKRVVAIDPPVSGPGRRAYPAQLPWYVDSIRLARLGIGIEQMRVFCPTWTDDQLRLRAEWLHTCNERAVVTSFDGFHTDDIHSNLSSVSVPVHLMVASRGDVVRPEDVSELAELLPTMTTTKVADAGHMIPWDNEEGFYAAFGTFLGARLTPAAS